MFKNYLKIAWRSLWKNKLYSFINIGGLAIGMAVSFILLLYVYNELSFDRFHVKSDRLYQAYQNKASEGEVRTDGSSPVQLAAVLQKDYPEIERTARFRNQGQTLVGYNHNSFKMDVSAADASFLDMFTLNFVSGDQAHVFDQPGSVIISQSAAKTLFGNKEAIGQVVKLDNTQLARVAGVIKDLPENSTLHFSILMPWALLEAGNSWIKTSGWGNFSFTTYALLKPGVNADRLNKQLKHIIGRYNAENKDAQIFLYPFTRIHLHSEFKNGVNTGGGIEYVRLFLLLAIGILLIACINFMNLSTARSQKRAREVGVRKVVGAGRFAIIQQFLGESIVMAIFALLVAIVLVVLLLPYFNTIIGQNLQVPYHEPVLWISALLVTLITGFIAGSYPALFLSSFKPVKVLKGLTQAGNATMRPRQVLVIIQFTFASCLILCSILIYKQITFIKDKPVGYNQAGLIEMEAEGVIDKNYENFRRDAINAGGIIDAAITSGSVTNNDGYTWGVVWPGQLAGEEKTPIDQLVGTYHLTSTYGMKVVQGRDFSIDRPADSTSIMLNQAAVKLMRLKDPIGEQVKWQGVNRTVIGVVQNFVWGSPYQAVKPAIIGFSKGWIGAVAMRLNPRKSVSASLAVIQQIYKKYNPDYPFQYKFVDEKFDGKFKTEKLLGILSAWFTSLAIFISCLGLFGLASFSAEQRKKEIGVRKVLGASVSRLWFNLSKEFIVLVMISFIIGAGISWYYMSQWLAQYAYHTAISIWVFAVTISISLIMCLITVSFQAIRAAIDNPVNSLRSE